MGDRASFSDSATASGGLIANTFDGLSDKIFSNPPNFLGKFSKKRNVFKKKNWLNWSYTQIVTPADFAGQGFSGSYCMVRWS